MERLKTSSRYHPKVVERQGLQELEGASDGDALDVGSNAFRLVTQYEFENANLMVYGFNEEYRAFVTHLSSQFQKEYGCNNPSEKATAHLAAQNYVRLLVLQRDINNILSAESYGDLKLRRLTSLNKAYDQANRQYLSCIQTLKTMKQPPLNVVVKSVHAIVGNQQMIQESYDNKVK